MERISAKSSSVYWRATVRNIQDGVLNNSDELSV